MDGLPKLVEGDRHRVAFFSMAGLYKTIHLGEILFRKQHKFEGSLSRLAKTQGFRMTDHLLKSVSGYVDDRPGFRTRHAVFLVQQKCFKERNQVRIVGTRRVLDGKNR